MVPSWLLSYIKVHQLEGHGWHYINMAGEYTILPSINEFIKNEKPTATQMPVFDKCLLSSWLGLS